MDPKSSLKPEPRLLPTFGPLPLTPCVVPKPWGHEVWHTGMEARGTATIGGVPLGEWLQCDPIYMLGGGSLPLLKCLCPRVESPDGDLYLELHREKSEVYVVANVDTQVWPQGVGEVVWGLNASLFHSYSNTSLFLQDFKKALTDYEALRHSIDTVSPQEAPHPDLITKEPLLRQKLLSFTGRLKVRVGDVVAVPTGVPHSLRHGVDVVEFQTPVYERLILAFWQKVVTQNHWDIDEALKHLDVDGSLAPTRLGSHIEGVERVVDFPDFWVDRWVLGVGEKGLLQGGRARVVYVIQGEPAWLGPHCPPGGWLTPAPGAWLLPAGQDFGVRGPGVFLVGTNRG